MTERIYYTDPYVQTFSARIVKTAPSAEGWRIKLDRTAFYPATGGQRSDRGWLAGLRVLDVIEAGDEIEHLVEGSPPDPGSEVEGRIDWALRFEHMQQHTAQHILSRAFELACGARTESFHMSAATSTIDLEVETLEPAQIEAAEHLANQVVMEMRQVHVSFIDATDQGEAGLRKPSQRAGTLRIVEVNEFDRSACGGTHCRNTGEIGQILVRGSERMRRKLRIEFVAGWRALKEARRSKATVDELVGILSASPPGLGEAALRLTENEKSAKREILKLKESLLEFEIERAISDRCTTAGFDIVVRMWEGLDMKQLNLAASLILRGCPTAMAVVGSKGAPAGLVLAKSPGIDVDLKNCMGRILATAGGRGGGTPDRMQAGGCDPSRLESAIQNLRTQLAQAAGNQR